MDATKIPGTKIPKYAKAIRIIRHLLSTTTERNYEFRQPQVVQVPIDPPRPTRRHPKWPE
jgi:hypothetical protein